MEVIINMASVFAVSIIELWLGIPLGLFLNLNPILISISAACGSIFSAFFILTVGDRIRSKFIKWRYGDKSPNQGKIYEIWRKYGIIGLGLISPLLFGAPLGAALGIGLGAPKKGLLLWMSVGIIIWSILLTSAGYLGLISFENISK